MAWVSSAAPSPTAPKSRTVGQGLGVLLGFAFGLLGIGLQSPAPVEGALHPMMVFAASRTIRELVLKATIIERDHVIHINRPDVFSLSEAIDAKRVFFEVVLPEPAPPHGVVTRAIV